MQPKLFLIILQHIFPIRQCIIYPFLQFSFPPGLSMSISDTEFESIFVLLVTNDNWPHIKCWLAPITCDKSKDGIRDL